MGDSMKWANLVGCNQSSPDGSDSEKSKSGRRFIPPAKIRQWANESTEGGTATCCKCHQRFAMYYIVLVKVSSFKEDFACKDCRKKYTLQVIR